MSWVRIPPNPNRYQCFLVGPNIIKGERKQNNANRVKIRVHISSNPWALYLYAMRSPATKEKYVMRLGKFLSFLNLQGTLEDKARFFADKGKYDSIFF